MSKDHIKTINKKQKQKRREIYMAKLQFTREEARELFDLLPKRLNHLQFDERLKHTRLGLVKTANGYQFMWVTYTGKTEPYVTFIPLPASTFYTVVPPQVYKRKGILASVDELYVRVNSLLPQLNAGITDVGVTTKAKTKTHKQKFAEWGPNNYDSSYQPPIMSPVEGYMGANGWEGSKANIPSYQNPIAPLLRKAIKEAVLAGYLPCDVKYYVKVRSGVTDSITITVKAIGMDVGIDRLELLKTQVTRVVNDFNYNKSNTMVDYFDRGFYETVNIVTEEE